MQDKEKRAIFRGLIVDNNLLELVECGEGLVIKT